MSTSLIVRSSTSAMKTALGPRRGVRLSRFVNAMLRGSPGRSVLPSRRPNRVPRFRGSTHDRAVAFFEGQRPIRGYICVPHHNLISRGPSRGRGTLDGVPTWPPDIRGTDVLPATDRRHAHPPERVRPERPWADRDLPRNPVPTRDFGPERPWARALPRDLGRHARGSGQFGRRPRLEAHLRPPEHRPPRVGRPPPHVYLHRLRVDLNRVNRVPGSPRRARRPRPPWR